MDISELFKGEHAMIDEDKLVPLSMLEKKQLGSFSLSSDSLEVVQELLKVDLKYLYFDLEGGINPFCYWDKLFYFSFLSLEQDYLTMKIGKDFTIAKQFKLLKEKIYSLKENEEWENLMFFSDKKVSLLVFLNVKDSIPKDKRKDIFLQEYKRNEYGFERLNQNIIREILTMKHSEKYNIKKYDKLPDKNGYYTIYRGVTYASSPLDRSYSWTLDKGVATFFAKRFNSNGKVLKAKVHESKIRAYIPDIGEEEVLVFPEDIDFIE